MNGSNFATVRFSNILKMKRHPDAIQKELAAMIGISDRHVRRLKKKL